MSSVCERERARARARMVFCLCRGRHVFDASIRGDGVDNFAAILGVDAARTVERILLRAKCARFQVLVRDLAKSLQKCCIIVLKVNQ